MAQITASSWPRELRRVRFHVPRLPFAVAGQLSSAWKRSLALRARILALWPYAGVALTIAILMYPAWLPRDTLIVGGDTLQVHYPWFVLWRDVLAAGDFPYWNPYTLSGLPAFATLQSGYGYPVHWLLSDTPPATAINWLLAGHVVLAGLGAVWCAARIGAPREGQLLSGLAFSLGSAVTARLWAGHLSFVEGLAWLPIATGLAIGIPSPASLLILPISIGMMAVAGQPELVIFSAWWLPIWAAYAAWARQRRLVIPAALLTAAGVALGIALAAYQLLPTYELYSISNRAAGMSWEFRTTASLQPWHALELLAPFAFGTPEETYWAGAAFEWHERFLYIGIVPLFAAGLAVGRWRWLCWGLAAATIALALGRYTPWYGWTESLPGYPMFRIPSRHLCLTALALSLAAGLGIRRLHGLRVGVLALGATFALIVTALQFAWRIPVPTIAVEGWDLLRMPTPPVSIGLQAGATLLPACLVLIMLAWIAALPQRLARVGMILLALADLTLTLQSHRVHESDPQQIVTSSEIFRGYDRVAYLSDLGPTMANYGPVVGVVQAAGYTPLMSAAYMQLLTGKVSPEVVAETRDVDNPALRILGYHVLVDPYKPLVTIAPPPPPEAWVARCALPGGVLEARQRIFPRSTCITLPGIEPVYDNGPAGLARIVDRGNNTRWIEAAGPGWLVTTIPWYPGWSAWVDDQPANVTVVDGALVGVQLTNGNHTVVLDYRPAGLDEGIAITSVAGQLLAFITLGLLAAAAWRPTLRPLVQRGVRAWKSRGHARPAAS